MTATDMRRFNGSETGAPVVLPDGYTWADFLRRHGARIRFRNDTGCWEWTGARLKAGGYGAVRCAGRAQRAHRVAWTLLRGELPRRLTLDHLCRRTACLNPSHMELVTAGENRRRAPIAGWAAIHAAKATCLQGHPFDGFNGKQRTCSTCHRKATREHAARKRAARKAAA